MADEQSNTPSAEEQAPDAAASEPSSDRSEAPPSESPPWWRRMFSRRGDEPEAQESVADKVEEQAPSRLSLTQEELDRRVQAETDRREAKRAAEAKARAKRDLRDSDPFAYVEQERAEEQQVESNAHVMQFLSNAGTQHDRVSIDPIFMSLPKAEQERIQKLDGAGVGLAGRKLVVQESLKALEKQWKAEGAKEAEAKLRRNPAFRKQVLAELRGQTTEPDLLPSGGASEADKTMSAILRTHYRLG